MTTHDNAPPPEGWRPEPRYCELDDCLCESAIQAQYLHDPAGVIRGEN